MVVSFLLLINLISCERDEPFNANLEKLVDRNNHYDGSLLAELKNEGLKIVPSLIKEIDKDETGAFGRCYTWESDLSNLFSYVGVRAAYMIEYLLYDSSEIYQKCERRSIAKRDTSVNGVDFVLPELKDMRKLKQIYKNWWDTNKGETLQELQIKYKERRILDGSEFYWR